LVNEFESKDWLNGLFDVPSTSTHPRTSVSSACGAGGKASDAAQLETMPLTPQPAMQISSTAYLNHRIEIKLP